MMNFWLKIALIYYFKMKLSKLQIFYFKKKFFRKLLEETKISLNFAGLDYFSHQNKNIKVCTNKIEKWI